MRRPLVLAAFVSALLIPAAAAGGPANGAPRITRAAVTLETAPRGRRAVDARLTVCDDSQGGSLGHLLLEQRLFRGNVLWAFLRSREPIAFTAGCFRYRVRFVLSPIFSGSGARYTINLRVADADGKRSNAIRRSWALR